MMGETLRDTHFLLFSLFSFQPGPSKVPFSYKAFREAAWTHSLCCRGWLACFQPVATCGSTLQVVGYILYVGLALTFTTLNVIESHPEVSPSQPWHLTYVIPVAIRCSGGCCWVVTFKSLGGSSTRQSIRSEFTFISVLTVGEFRIYIFILIYIWTLAGNSSA